MTYYPHPEEFCDSCQESSRGHTCCPHHQPSEEACPGCGAEPGDGLTEGCSDEGGCGFYRDLEQSAQERWLTSLGVLP